MDNFGSRRPRGVNFILGGTLVACAFLAFSLFSGQVDLGIGVPDVRIDRP
ncbi:hypothetical protein JANAI62_25110 [Jannaschia pagri]|uniref:Uncharacterized protein n=1 Tax=Jannaschia pagri TaxID=2829797 RepID=A0ABQ4NN91_9RHOB|nr:MULTISPECIES: hypothetical protein [unclassified Jannaschia]GIT95888.1 hypothetical protein JANAI62_25110 [Jannaschia sp. AI_62]